MKKMIAVCMFASLGLAGWSLTTDSAKVNTRLNHCYTSFKNCQAAAKQTCGTDLNCLTNLLDRCVIKYHQCLGNNIP